MIDIKTIRKNLKLSQVEFGKKMGYTHSYISNIETGKEALSDKFLEKLNEVYGIEVDQFKGMNQQKLNVMPDNLQESEVKEWKDKYYSLLEKYNSCLEEKNELLKDGRPKVRLSDKTVSK